ncbi:MAG: hypothetical protein IT249_01090 [Chitinophagaceae bacterium]|nr:hypothetical protein [Chitinophagaceae bacterium]
MNDNNMYVAIKTTVRVDQGVDAVKETINGMLENDPNISGTPVKHISGNTFVLGWVKSFKIIMISVTLRKESEERTAISLEAIEPEPDSKVSRIVQEGFYDFLSFFKTILIPQNMRRVDSAAYAQDNSNTGLWKWIFFILLATFMTWYFYQR